MKSYQVLRILSLFAVTAGLAAKLLIRNALLGTAISYALIGLGIGLQLAAYLRKKR